MAMVPLLRHCAKNKKYKCLTRGITEVYELKEILSDVMFNTSEGELYEIPEGLSA